MERASAAGESRSLPTPGDLYSLGYTLSLGPHARESVHPVGMIEVGKVRWNRIPQGTPSHLGYSIGEMRWSSEITVRSSLRA